VSLPRCECRRPRLQQQALVRDLTHMFLPDGGRSALKSTRSRSVCCLTHELSQLGPAFRGRFVLQRSNHELTCAAIHDWQSIGCDLSGSRWLLDKLSPAPKRSRPGPATALPIKEVAALGALLFCGLRAAIDGPVTFRTSRSPARSDIWGNDRPLCPQPPGGPDEPRSVPPSRGSFIGGLGVTDFRREGCCPIFGTTRRHLSAKLREWP